MATRRDFVALANALRRARPMQEIIEGREDQWKLCVAEVVNALRETSSTFDEVRFRRECGLEE